MSQHTIIKTSYSAMQGFPSAISIHYQFQLSFARGFNNANTSSLSDVAVATQPQHEYIGKYQNLNLRLVFPPAKCFRAVLPMASFLRRDAICTTHPFPSKTATCAAASWCHGRCDAAELQCLYEPQMLALQPTCFRSHAVKRLLARKLWPAWSAVLLSSP